MIPLDATKGKGIAVMGLGRSGLAAAQALLASGARVYAWDDDAARREAAAASGVPVVELLNGVWEDIEQLVLSPGIAHTHPQAHPVASRAREHGAEILGDIELLTRSGILARTIGITGTNGKSTTTALIGHILQSANRAAQIGGNLGTPALALEPLDATGHYVLELSSYQLDLMPSAAFDVAVLLNISADHLDRHGGLDGYIAAKRRIFTGCGGTAIVGVDDPDCAAIHAALAEDHAATLIPISGSRRVAGGVYAEDGTLYDATEGDPVAVMDIGAVETLPGPHNAQNAAAAYAAARTAGLTRAEIADAIARYPGLAHRQQRVATIDGIDYVNDSKATNPDAAARALSCYETIYWIAGGLAKEGGLDAIGPYLGRVRHAFLIGDAAADFAAILAGRVETHRCGTLDAALAEARRLASSEGAEDAVVLLSPACASFDQYASFEARGAAFARQVSQLPGARRQIAWDGEWNGEPAP